MPSRQGQALRARRRRVDLDGTGFVRLTDDGLDHDAVSPPEGGYLVDRASTPSLPPRSVVLGGDGQVLVELESPDTAELEAVGWTPPERFRVTAADGKASIHGLLWRPHGFDPDRSYPVIDHIYPGPQVHRAGPSFDVPHHGEPEALAALGFAVVAVDGRGTAGRSKAFHDHVLPAQTLRLVGALVDADKDVDLLIVPGAEHALLGRMHHVLRRTWDYFVRHLHGTEPPPYRLAPLPLPPGLALA